MFLVPRNYNTFNTTFFNDEDLIPFRKRSFKRFNNCCFSNKRSLRQPRMSTFFNDNLMDNFVLELFEEPFLKRKQVNYNWKAPKRNPENNKFVSEFFNEVVPFANEDSFFNFDRHFEDNFFNIRPKNAENKLYETNQNVEDNIKMNKESPKFYKKTFESSYINNNGNKSEIIRKSNQKDDQPKEIFVTQITEDVNGNKKVKHLNPEKFENGEFEALSDDQVLRAIDESEKKIENGSKIIEENENITFEEFQKNSDKKSDSEISNEGKNKMFESVQF